MPHSNRKEKRKTATTASATEEEDTTAAKAASSAASKWSDPFLPDEYYERDDGDGRAMTEEQIRQREELEGHIVAFHEYSSSASRQDGGSGKGRQRGGGGARKDGDSKISIRLAKSATFLLRHLRRHQRRRKSLPRDDGSSNKKRRISPPPTDVTADERCCFLSNTEIAGLLLSWSVQKQILSSTVAKQASKKTKRGQRGYRRRILPWRTLECCLLYLLPATTSCNEGDPGGDQLGRDNGESRNYNTSVEQQRLEVRRILTPSTLNKLVPKLAFTGIRQRHNKLPKQHQKPSPPSDLSSGSGESSEYETSSSGSSSGSDEDRELLQNRGSGQVSSSGSMGQAHRSSRTGSADRRKRTSTTTDPECVRACAARCYRLLLTSGSETSSISLRSSNQGYYCYRPTLDIACTALLLKLIDDDAMRLRDYYTERCVLSIYKGDAIEYDVLRTTIQLVRNLHFSRRGNPKTAFQLFSSRSVFLAVARVYLYALFEPGSGDNDNDTEGFLVSEIDTLPSTCCKCSREQDSLGKCCCCIRTMICDLLDDVFFHPQHHMEGFRSLLQVVRRRNLPKSSSPSVDGNVKDVVGELNAARPERSSGFKCYQEEILILLRNFLMFPETDDGHEGGDKSHRHSLGEARDVIWIVPVLLRGFLRNSELWSHSEKNLGSNPTARRRRAASLTTDVTQMQFRMFSSLSTLLLDLIEGARGAGQLNIVAIASHALMDVLKLLLQHNAYLPAEDDNEKTQYAFLETLATELLNVPASDDSGFGISQLSDAISGVRLLVELDHRLVHERLESVFVLCLKCQDPRLHQHAVSLFSTVVDTYRQLRQQDFLFNGFLSFVESNFIQDQQRISDDATKAQLMVSYLESPVLTQAIAEAIQSCPILQTKEIFNAITSEMSRISNEISSDKSSEGRLQVVVRLSVLVARNVRVDGSTAASVASACRAFVTNPVTDLLRKREGNSFDISTETTKASLSLCGWFIELHLRCAFWLGRTSVLSIPKRLLDILRTVSKARANEGLLAQSRPVDQWECISNELLFLACHRLRQLHSLMYENQCLEQEDMSHGEEASDIYTDEANDLAAFAVAVSVAQRSSSSSAPKSHWATIAENFAVWAPFATTPHIDHFLNWFFSVLSIDSRTSPSLLPPESMAYRKEHAGPEVDIQCARALVRDASFFEDKKVLGRLSFSASACCGEWLSWALTDCFPGDSRDYQHLKNLVCTKNEKAHLLLWDIEKSVELSQTVTHVGACPNDAVDLVTTKLKQAMCPIKVLNGLNAESVFSDGGAVEFVLYTLKLDHVCRSLAFANKSFGGTVMRLVGGLRLSMGNALKAISSQNLQCRPGLGTHSLVFPFAESAIKMIDMFGGVSSCEAKALLHGTSTFLRHLFRLSPDRSERESTVAIAVAKIARNDRSDCCDTQEVNRSIAVLGRVFLEALPPMSSPKENARYHDAPKSVRNHLWNLVHKNDEAEMIILLGDLLRFSAAWNLEGCWPHCEDKDAIVTFSIELLDSKEVSSEKREALKYLIACVVDCSPTPDVSQQIVEKICLFPQADPLLDASFCRLVITATAEPLREIVERLLISSSTTFETKGDLAGNYLRLMRLMVVHVDETECCSVMHEFGSKIFDAALSHLHARTPVEGMLLENRQTAIIEACSILEELIRRRGIIVFRERDLARVLCRICSVVGPGGGEVGGAKNIKSDMSNVPTVLLGACAQVLVSMFQRYTNYLYACVPSVILVLHSFLDRALYERNLTDIDVSERGQIFGRVCELLIAHKDIYKKHLLGLLLEFVHALHGDDSSSADKNVTENSLSLARKESIMPAIFCLLDSLSSYEMKQLNALMDPKGKILFRTVYESYQKTHTYKGH